MSVWEGITQHWDFTIATIIAVVGIGISIGIALWQRRPKQLDYAVINDVDILNPYVERLKSKLEVLYGSTPVKDPRIVTVRIMNTGKKAIKRDDFDELISIGYETNQPFEATLAATKGPDPDSVSVVWTGNEEGWRVTASARLLNAGEWFDVQLVSDGPHGTISCTSRFADQSRKMKLVNFVDKREHTTMFITWYALGFVALLLSMTPSSSFLSWEIRSKLIVVFGLLYFVVMPVARIVMLRLLARREEPHG